MFCPVCGKEIPNGAAACMGCGCMVKSFNQNMMSRPAYQPTPQYYAPSSDRQIDIAAILGILGILFAFIFALIGHVLSIIGIVIGLKEYREMGNRTGLAISIIGEVLCICSSVIGAITGAMIMSSIVICF